MKRPQLAAAAIAILGAAGCASDQTLSNADYDPWERFNRGVYAFNDGADKVLLKPVARGYRTVVPGFARRGVSNFFDNLSTPRSALNNFLQGKGGRGFADLGRFVFNSTFGVAGLVDVAEAAGLEEYDEDFGQTLAVWGVPRGPYLVLPFLGPSSVRDAAGRPFDAAADPINWIDDDSDRVTLRALFIIDLRQRLLSAEEFLEDSQDPYITLRESYLQNRDYEIHDGDPPMDDFYDDFEDFEDFEDIEP